DIELHFILTHYQVADIFTKPLDEPTFKILIVELVLCLEYETVAPRVSTLEGYDIQVVGEVPVVAVDWWLSVAGLQSASMVVVHLKGHFDMLALSFSFVISEAYGPYTRIGGLSITLFGPSGQVFGDVVARLLVDAI
nr:AT-hook motif nuclear-localized protein 10 [Tanacetum cinerariifolium]